MGDKKDPGKFTIRFNIADPQQQTVVELLNRQGRYKAQFITSAVLLYAYAASDPQTAPLLSGVAIQHIVTDVKSSQQKATPINEHGSTATAAITSDAGGDNDLGIADMDAIRRTMEIFRTNKDGA